jgi:hypothetical protein
MTSGHIPAEEAAEIFWDPDRFEYGTVIGLFSGIGGFELGFLREGFQIGAVCEIEPFCQEILTSSYGSCRGGGKGRVGKWRKSLQSIGILHPQDWEKMMGFPIGWTDAKQLEMPLSPILRRFSLVASKK